MAELITLEQYKDARRINSTTRDEYFQELISQVSAYVENYCNRVFTSNVSTSIIEWHDAKTNIVYLRQFPVIAVNSVKVSTDGGLNQTTLTENDPAKGGYYVDLDAGAIYTQNQAYTFLNSNYYETPYRSLEVDYYAGYTTLPKDLELAIIDLVDYYKNDESKPTKNLLGATLDNPLPYIGTSLPAHIRRILDLYRYSPG